MVDKFGSSTLKRLNNNNDNFYGPPKKRRNFIVESLNKNTNTGVRSNGKPIKEPQTPPLPPIPGYFCSSNGCNKSWSGDQSDVWYHMGSKNQWLCLPCGRKFSHIHACPICGLCFSEEDSEDESSNWIQCDNCQRWVMTKCDGISDLSIYDDSNPNHLPYKCPLCSNKMKELTLIFKTRKSLDTSEVKNNNDNDNGSDNCNIIIPNSEFNMHKIELEYDLFKMDDIRLNKEKKEKIQNLEKLFKEEIINKRESLEITINHIHTYNQLEYEKIGKTFKKTKGYYRKEYGE